MIDPLFRVEVISQTARPQAVIYAAMHQDYSEKFVFDEIDWLAMKESDCGDRVVKHLLAGHRGHYGPLEHPQIVLNCGWFPHSTMQQIRTHRLTSFDVQSFRYTGQRIYKIGDAFRDAWESGVVYKHRSTIEGFEDLLESCANVFYLRPVGFYSDRQGKKYEYTEDQRNQDIFRCLDAAKHYADRINDGFSEEHARGLIPFDVRQHWVMSMNMRSLIHLLQIRGKKDAQLECQQLCELILPHFEAWAPEIYAYFMENLWLKGRLAP